jgi:hypothetical protein
VHCGFPGRPLLRACNKQRGLNATGSVAGAPIRNPQFWRLAFLRIDCGVQSAFVLHAGNKLRKLIANEIVPGVQSAMHYAAAFVGTPRSANRMDAGASIRNAPRGSVRWNVAER